MTTRNAASLFTGAGPGATVALSAAMPPCMKSLRHSRTWSSRTPNASAMRGLVKPASVNITARAVGLAAFARVRQRRQSNTLFLGCRERRLSSHVPHLRIGCR
jgi:hypothetical protein